MIEQKTKIATLTFTREPLLYDIGNYAYIQGDAIPGDETKAQSKIIDLTQEGNVDRVTRTLDIAYAVCAEFLYPYTKNVCSQEESRDNTLTETDAYVLSLRLPDDFSRTTIDLIAKLIHEYMVYYVMADWLSLTYPAISTVWSEKLGAVEKEIKSRLNARCGRVRRTQSPF